MFPTDAWNLIVSWYGVKDGSPIIRRFAHDTAPPGSLENVVYELNPPIFTIRKLRTDSSTSQDAHVLGPRIVASRSELYQSFLRAVKSKAAINLKTKVQVWRLLAPVQQVATMQSHATASGILTPESSRNGSPNPTQSRLPLLVSLTEFDANDDSQREKIEANDETANEKYNGHLNLQIVGLAENQVLILEEQIGGPAGGEFPSDGSKKLTIKNGVLLKGNAGNSRNKNTDSGRNSPAPGGPITRGRTRRDGRTRGSVGLTNLGNTCYMNSALQCIRSVEELTLYFLEQKYKEDLNPGNPLGHGGTIAKNYAGLLSAVYDDTGLSTFTPKSFKYAVGRAQPLFSGYGQQDSQEFLSFLVDGLHEDLNRILKKPYVENPESDDKTVNDPEAIRALGEKFREIHHARNDSVAMDLFNGFYKNTMVCPDCSKVSITFDPFSLLTLQLPIENTWQHTITFAPLHGPPVQIDVDLDKNGSIRSLKEFVAKRIPGLKWNRLMCAEIYSHKFYRTFEDSKSIAESNIQARDDIVMYELDDVPTNFPPPPKKKTNRYRSMVWNHSSDEDIPDSDSPLADRMIVPIFHRVQNSNTYSNSMGLKLWPSYILVTREEAKDYDSILRKVLAKVGTMTTRPILTEFGGDYEPFDESRNASDTVLTTEEDASSNVDPRVQDGSIEGEGSMVGITVDEPADTPADQNMEEGANIDVSQELPEVLRPGSFIQPEYRSMFQMKYAKANKELVPTGWHAIDPSKNYPSIESRIRIVKSRRSSMDSTEDALPSSSGEEADDTIQFSANVQDSFDQANQSSEEELPTVESFSRAGRRNNHPKSKRGKKNNKFTTQYTKKGKGRFIDQPIYNPSEPDSDEDPALIRLGEAIVLDWATDAFDGLFEGTTEDDFRGWDTWKVMETLDDPELRQTKAKRAARRKNGVSLQECFAETSKGEILSEENAWYCSRCKELRRASKTLEIWTLPDILVVHLKRFSAHRGFRDKIDVLIDFPVEGLDLTERVGLPEGKSMIYDLFAVDNHYGGLGGGHYTAFAQNFYDKQWYEYNDSSVSKRNPASVVTPAAYLLFYRRRADAPLGPPYLQKVVEKAYAPSSEETLEDDSQANSRQNSRSPAGNGLRLDGFSRNGSSSAGIGVGAGHLRGGGSGSGAAGRAVAAAAGSHHGIENQEEDENTDVDVDADAQPPAYDDEGFGEEMPFALGGFSSYQIPWSFSSLEHQHHDQMMQDDMASDAAMDDGDNLETRILEDFGDDGDNAHPGTPMSDDEPPALEPEGSSLITSMEIPPIAVHERMEWAGVDDDAVQDVVLDAEDAASAHAKTD